MTITTHTAIGSVIGISVGNPLLGFVLGFLSHFLVDMIPHGDTGLSEQFRIHKQKKLPVAFVSIDSIVAIFLLLVVMSIAPYYISRNVLAFAVAGSILPDLLIGIYDLTKTKYLAGFNRMHFFFHDFFSARFGDVKLRWGLAYQLVIVAVVLALL